MMSKTTLLILALFVSNLTIAQVEINGKKIIGIWKTVDDETGRVKSKVKVYEKNGRIYGRIAELLDPESLAEAGVETFREIICENCPKNHGKDKPVLGLQIIWNMELDGNRLSGGDIMDPKNGKIYGCSIWLDEDDTSGNTLKVRGWLAFFYRTQTWYRVE